jgi:dolichol-phosphate mannosyltransferase
VRRAIRRSLALLRLAALAVTVARLVATARRRPPVRPTHTPLETISVVVPARDEAERIGAVLAATVGAPGVTEVLVVDDRSSDGTADVARQAGATVVAGEPLPDGWTGKAWALQQGLLVARGDWVVTLDADTRPDPRLPQAMVARAVADGLDLLTVAGRFECPTAGVRWLHPAMLTTLVYRFGAPGAEAAVAPDRVMANGQCTAVPRERFRSAGGFEPVASHPVEDVALARHLAGRGRKVGFLDAAELLTVRMYDTFSGAFAGWGRSLALPGVEPPRRQAVDLAIVVVAQALPLPRLVLRRADVVDVAFAAVRVGTLVGTRSAYTRHDVAYWCSPFADLVAVVALAGGVVRRRQTWRGRRYDVPTARRPPPARTAARRTT